MAEELAQDLAPHWALMHLAGLWVERPEEVRHQVAMELPEGVPLDGGGDHQVLLPENLRQPDFDFEGMEEWERPPLPSNRWNLREVPREESQGRLRPRGRTLCQAWACLLGLVRDVDGLLTTVVDGPPVALMSRYVKAVWGDEAKLRGVQRVSLGGDEEDFLLKLTAPGVKGDRWISVRIFAALYTWVLFKERTMELLAGLRSKAVQEARNLKYPWPTFACVAADTISSAFMVTEREKRAWDRISGVCGRDTLEYSARYSRGEVDPGLWRTIAYGISRAYRSLPGPHALSFKKA